MLVFLVFLESLAGVLLKRTKRTNITNKTIIYRGGKNSTHGSTPTISETISSIGLARRVYSFSFLLPCRLDFSFITGAQPKFSFSLRD